MAPGGTAGGTSSGRVGATLAARVERVADLPYGVTFVGAGEPVHVPYRQLHDEARAAAAALQGLGAGPGTQVAILGPTSRALVTLIQATWLTGAAAVVLPLPMRLGSLEEFVAQTRARVRNADSLCVVVDDDLAAFLDARPDDPPVVLLSRFAPGAPGLPRPDHYDAPVIDPASLAILQFTSGSTAEPKGVMLPHATVAANLDAIATAAHIRPDEDVAVSWLPLYHDMGLIGLLTLPMTTGTPLVLASPQDFLAAPARWLHWLSDYGGTCTAGPNFSYALAARAMGRAEGLDLSRWRLALNGAEPVDPSSVEAFAAAGARHRLDPRAVFPAFGMAEATLAVTFPEPFTGMAVDTVDTRVLETERYAAPLSVAPGTPGSRRLARLGRAVPGLEVRIVDPVEGVVRGDREVGELQVRGSSVTPGYFRRPDVTAATFDGDWLRTGDLAYLVGGELVVCGRIKDVIIVGGRNVFPEDVERAVGDVEGIRAGNVIAFGVQGRRGREALVVVAEARTGGDDALRATVARRVREVVGVPPEDVVLVAPGTLPKTSSGKLQRSLCRRRYADAALDVVKASPPRRGRPPGS